ncbi:amidohydrolase family protein [Henriciella aquimarina]|uniref:amidohydrolase family protein n=1 Tax=Henriciella aquimarina TaxID=545261 RepID=UPI000A014A42|nr:amidohydrolase family protein [Henriciella aquimarina]
MIGSLGRCAISAVALMASGAIASAQDVLVQDVQVFDVTSGEPYTADVLVENGRFARIADEIDETPDKALMIDGEGLSLLPGLIDTHTHWTGMNGATRATIATDLLEAGVTTATDFHAAPEAYGDMRAYHEGLISPHVFFAARMGVPFGHGADWTDQRMTRTVFAARDAKAAAEDVVTYKPDAIKVFADGWRYGSGHNESDINSDALKAIVDVAEDAGLPVFTHTVTVDGGKLAAKAGVTGIVHAIQDRTTDDELVEMMSEQGVYYTPTLTVYEPFEDEMEAMGPEKAAIVMERQKHSRANMKAFLEAGVKVAMGTDQGIDNNPFGEADLREMELMVDFGLTPAQALTAATLHSAGLLGLSEDRGSIQEGKRADFILVKGEPWTDISQLRAIDQVFVDGKQVVAKGELVGEQGPAAPEARPAQALIDDFEDPEKTNYDALRGHSLERGFPRTTLLTDTIERSEGGMALHLAAEMATKDDPYAFAVLPFSPAGFVPVDASEFDGVRFEARGNGDYSARLDDLSGQAVAGFETAADWQTIEIPFSEFEADADSRTLDVTGLRRLTLGRHQEPGTDFWLEIDNVEFYAASSDK